MKWEKVGKFGPTEGAGRVCVCECVCECAGGEDEVL